MDPLSDILDLIGVKSSVYFQKDFCAPWRMQIANTGFAQFHIIVQGEAVIEHAGRLDYVSTGDVILFPKGAAHKIGDSIDSPEMRGQDVITAMASGDEPFVNGGRATRMVCGHFDYDFNHRHPLIQELPAAILLRATELRSEDHLLGLVKLIVTESRTMPTGSRVVLRRLSDALLVTILRAYFETESSDVGMHIGLRDDRIARAIAAIHEVNGWELDLSDLASVAGMSRSSFAATFKATVGKSPGDYALRWKMLNAREVLIKDNTTIEEVAMDYGYSSSSAFSRAFVAMFGQTPREARTVNARTSPLASGASPHPPETASRS